MHKSDCWEFLSSPWYRKFFIKTRSFSTKNALKSKKVFRKIKKGQCSLQKGDVRDRWSLQTVTYLRETLWIVLSSPCWLECFVWENSRMRELFLVCQSLLDSSGNFRCAVYAWKGTSIHEIIPVIWRIAIIKHSFEDGIGVFLRAIGAQCIAVIYPGINDCFVSAWIAVEETKSISSEFRPEPVLAPAAESFALPIFLRSGVTRNISEH